MQSGVCACGVILFISVTSSIVFEHGMDGDWELGIAGARLCCEPVTDGN